MKELPIPENYEKEFIYMPWGILVEKVLNYIVKESPQNAEILDLMCGPGYLLGKIKQLKPELKLTGVDIDQRYIEFGKMKYPDIEFIKEDCLNWSTEKKFDVIVCTAGLHHLAYEDQEKFVEKIHGLLKDEGVAIIGDPYIDDFSDEQERQYAAAKLGNEYLKAVIDNNGPKEVISAAVDVLYNDVMMYEFKSSIIKNKIIFDSYFSFVELHKTWPQTNSGFGDYFFILKK